MCKSSIIDFVKLIVFNFALRQVSGREETDTKLSKLLSKNAVLARHEVRLLVSSLLVVVNL